MQTEILSKNQNSNLGLNTKKEERTRRRIKNYLEELKGFYNLEQLYMKAVAQLRGKIPENQESASPLGIQKEFRKANEEEWLMLSEELEEEMRRQQEEAGL